MDLAVWLGVGWGLLAAAFQHQHVFRSIRRRLKGPVAPPLWKAVAGMVFRTVVLVCFFLVAAFWDRIRLDGAIVAFAGGHLLGMFHLGWKSHRGGFEATGRCEPENCHLPTERG